jgi:3-isopropylmalate/(R)-2-methylmalate dehydratase large subunit
LILVNLFGDLKKCVSAKDLALTMIGLLGASGGAGFALEFAGAGSLTMEERLTLCNMSIECGAKMGLCPPDEIVFEWLRSRPLAPSGDDWDLALARWRTLYSDKGTVYEKKIDIELDRVNPRVTWGTNPAQNIDISGRVPSPSEETEKAKQQAAERALTYQRLTPGTRMEDIPVDYVFLGSCTNSRLSDLRAAAEVLKGRKVSSQTIMLVSPGSATVKAQAEKEGLNEVFRQAGAQWREPGCSMCLGLNGDILPAGRRSASTSNRNFEDRQGRGGLTHLVGPASAAAAAVAGYFRDPREYLRS